MAGVRQVPIPLDHFTAEVAAWPIGSVDALALAPLALDPCHSPEAGGSPTGQRTRRLWRRAERSLLSSFPAVSVDEAVTVRDWLWFPPHRGNPPRGPVSIATYLRELANRLLEAKGHLALPRAPDLPVGASLDANGPQDVPQARARRFFRWLSFALPPHLLLAAHPQTPNEMELLTEPLARRLADRGFVEPHLHVGAGLRFVDLWVSAMLGIGAQTQAAFGSPGAELDEGRQLAEWLLRFAIVRQWLAAYLAQSPARGETMERWIWRTLSALGPAQAALARTEIWRPAAAGQLGSGAGDQSTYVGLQALLRDFQPRGWRPPRPASYRELQTLDPIAIWVGGTQTDTPDGRLIRSGLRYVDDATRAGQADRCFEALFYQLIRLQCLVYRHMVQRPMTPGLQWFIRFYDRLRPARKPIAMRVRTEGSAAVGGLGCGLRSLEVRTAPSHQEAELKKDIRGICAAAVSLNTAAFPTEGPLKAGLEVGLVLHLIKQRGEDAARGHPSGQGRGFNADPRPFGSINAFGYRFGSYYDKTRRQVRALVQLLQTHPYALCLVRGVDACTDEQGIPNWVLAPLFRHAVEASACAAEVLAAHHPAWEPAIPRFRRTLHTGEDFVHLLGGLRRMDEAIEFFPLEQGDRLGHGLALGVDPARWCRQTGGVAMTLEERLLDLTWEWRLNSTGRASTGRDSLLGREIRRLAREIFDSDLEADAIDLLVRDLYRNDMLRRAGFPAGASGGPHARTWACGHSTDPPQDRPLSSATQRLELLRRYLTEGALYERGQRVEWINTELDRDALVALSGHVRQRVARRGLCVEANPSSNLLIGHLGQLKDHPLWRLRPPEPRPDLEPVRVCIGSDDPLTFAASLPTEYQLLADAMEASGFSACQQDQWIEDVRAAGMDSRFTLPWSSVRRVLEEVGSLWAPSPGFSRSVPEPP
jgi:hypothetical protein